MAGRFSVEAVFKAVDRVTAPISRMQNRIGKMTRSITRGLRNANRMARKLGRGLATGFKRAAIVGGVALAGLMLTINKVADRADSLAKRARRLNFPIDQLQEWQFVAEQSGLTTEAFDKAIEGMAKRMGEARAGTGSLFTFLMKTNKGLLRQLNGTTDVSQAMEILIKQMQNAKDPMERAALANAAFGRSGLKTANIAELGAKKIAALRKEQRENGLITREQAEAAEAYNDAMNSLKKSVAGFLQSVILPLLPQITEMTRRIRLWIVANRELISKKVLEFFRELPDHFKTAVVWAKKIGSAVEFLLKPITALMEAIDLINQGLELIKFNAKVKEVGGGSLFGFGDDEETGAAPTAGAQVVSPQERVARSIEERRQTSTAEVTIRDETGRAGLTKGTLGLGLTLETSGAF